MENPLSVVKDLILKETVKKIEISKEAISDLTAFSFRRKLEAVFKTVLKENDVHLRPENRDEVFEWLMAYFLGFGPIEDLLKTEEVTEIMINGPGKVYIERNGNLELTGVTFKDEEQLYHYVDKMLSHLGRRATELEPYVDTMLSDGSRVNIVRRPVCLAGPLVTIRKFNRHAFTMDELIKAGTITGMAADFVKACVIAKINILISGGAGSGKTTLLNLFASYMPEGDRTVVIEDTPELRITDKHAVFMVTRPPSLEGKGEITIRHLLRNALHMRPNRIIVGETRSDEAIDMIQAMNTGHDGSMTTIHANSPSDALDRLELLVLMGRPNITGEVARKMILNTINLVIQTRRMSDGSRKIVAIGEVARAKEHPIDEIFTFDDNQATLKATGTAPTFYDKLKRVAQYSEPAFGS